MKTQSLLEKVAVYGRKPVCGWCQVDPTTEHTPNLYIRDPHLHFILLGQKLSPSLSQLLTVNTKNTLFLLKIIENCHWELIWSIQNTLFIESNILVLECKTVHTSNLQIFIDCKPVHGRTHFKPSKAVSPSRGSSWP